MFALSISHPTRHKKGGGSSLKGPGRNPLAKKVKPGARSGRSGRGGDDERGERVSLRVGTGKKGRQTEVKMRRGSLRKKDRSREKAEKEERALERRTVYLPGSVLLLLNDIEFYRDTFEGIASLTHLYFCFPP